jgi:transcription elongation factor
MGTKVRVMEGEQKGLVGESTKITEDVLTFAPNAHLDQLVDVPLSSVRSHFHAGDNVQIKVGGDVGKFGCVIEVRYEDQTNMITFIDEVSTKSGYPMYVSLLMLIVSLCSKSIPFR